jgi:hypothetical protein
MNQARERRIKIVQQRLLRRGTPRFLVFVILFLAGVSGFFTSFLLLRLGISQMWIRYPIAILVAYAGFFVLLRLWIGLLRRHENRNVDLPEVDLDLLEVTARRADSFHFGGGGDFGGAGAGGSFGENLSSAAARTTSGGGGSNIGGVDLDLGDEGCLIVVAVLALVGGLVAALYVVYIAPALLAEIIVDGVLMVGLYRRVKRIEQTHWLRAAVRQTILPAIVVAIFFTIAGYAMQKAVPSAHSIGDVWNHLMQR